LDKYLKEKSINLDDETKDPVYSSASAAYSWSDRNEPAHG
jgi:hypothetical protein